MPRTEDEDDRARPSEGSGLLFLLAYFGGIVAIAAAIVAGVHFTQQPAETPDLASQTPPPADGTPDNANPVPNTPRTPSTRRTPSTKRGPTSPGFQPIPADTWKEFQAYGVSCKVPGDATFTPYPLAEKSLAAIRPKVRAYQSSHSFYGYYYLYIFDLDQAEAEKLRAGTPAALDDLFLKAVRAVYKVDHNVVIDDKVKPTDAPFLEATGRSYLGVRVTFSTPKMRAGVSGTKFVIAICVNPHEGPDPYPASTRFLDSVRVSADGSVPIPAAGPKPASAPPPGWTEFKDENVICLLPPGNRFSSSVEVSEHVARVRAEAKAYKSNYTDEGYMTVFLLPLKADEAKKLRTAKPAAFDDLLMQVVEKVYVRRGMKADDTVKPTDAPFLGKIGRDYTGLSRGGLFRLRAGAAGNVFVVATFSSRNEKYSEYPPSVRFLESVRVP